MSETNEHPPPGISIYDVITPCFANIRIGEEIWSMRLQDTGCTKESLKKSTYRQNKIPAYGPSQLYFLLLAATAIDFVKAINKEKVEGAGWKWFPRNSSDVKLKIIEILLSLRKLNSENEYQLEQNVILRMMDNQWGENNQSQKTEDNDKLRLFRLLFHENNSDKLHRLSVGITSRNQLEDPSLQLKG